MFSSKKKEEHNLTDIVRGIQWAVSSAIQATESQYITTLKRFFEKQEDGTYKAIEAEIVIDDEHSMKVPLISLVNPNGLILKKMKVDMVVKVDGTTIKNVLDANDGKETDITRSSFKVSFNQKNKDNGKTVGLTMEFDSSESPEGVSRVLEQLTNNIQPQKNIKEEQE